MVSLKKPPGLIQPSRTLPPGLLTPRVTHMANDHRTCADFRSTIQSPDRRSFVKAGILGAAGLSLGDLLKAEENRAKPTASLGNVNSVIILWMRGGPSHHDTWD